MGFKASEQVDPLDYDFEPYLEASGTIPEPSQDQIQKLFEAARTTAVEAGVQPGDSREQMIEALAQIPEDEQERLGNAIVDALVEFCQGHPSREEIEDLPWRPRNAFVGWLLGQFAGDLGKVVTGASPATPNGAAPSS